MVGQPAAGARIEVQPLRLLESGTAALPGEHRSLCPDPSGGLQGCGESSVPVHQKGASGLGEVEGEVGQDEQLVPEDVPPVRLAVKAAGGDAAVELRGVGREGLQHVEGVQSQNLARLSGHFQLAFAPKALPGCVVGGQQGGEVRGVRGAVDAPPQRIGRGTVA